MSSEETQLEKLEEQAKNNVGKFLQSLDKDGDGRLTVKEQLDAASDLMQQHDNPRLEQLKSQVKQEVCENPEMLAKVGDKPVLDDFFNASVQAGQQAQRLNDGHLDMGKAIARGIEKVLPTIQATIAEELPGGVEPLTAQHVCESELLSPASAGQKPAVPSVSK